MARTIRASGITATDLNAHPTGSRVAAMTLIEMLVVVFIVGAGLFLLNGWLSGAQQEARRDLAVRLLADLDRALIRYHRATNCYPSSHGPNSAADATITLLDHDRTRPILEALPISVWRERGKRTLVDPWGTPLLYFSPASDSPWVRANNDRPVFVSAGPDRDFGDIDPVGLGDNVRSDDPGPNGFRLHQALRETMMIEEPPNGEEDD